jgi:hypothetical protein
MVSSLENFQEKSLCWSRACYIFRPSEQPVGISTDGLDDRMIEVRFPAGAGNFSLHHRVQNGSGSYPSSYPMGTRALSRGVKRPGCEAHHSPPSSVEVKNAWSYTSTLQYASKAWCLVKNHIRITSKITAHVSHLKGSLWISCILWEFSTFYVTITERSVLSYIMIPSRVLLYFANNNGSHELLQ